VYRETYVKDAKYNSVMSIVKLSPGVFYLYWKSKLFLYYRAMMMVHYLPKYVKSTIFELCPLFFLSNEALSFGSQLYSSTEENGKT
jgi:hypothetical protein